MKSVSLMVVLLFLTGCGGFFTIGESDFSCPRVRSEIVCMPPSEIEKLDEAGKLDWRWKPYSGSAVRDDLCTLSEAYAYFELCGPGKKLRESEICKRFTEKCLTDVRILIFKGSVHPYTDSPELKSPIPYLRGRLP